MGWSISPNTGLASIDANGNATFSNHSSDTVYTISYDGFPGCASVTSKQVTVYACDVPPTVTYTYTVYSNQNGASVSWSSGESGTISNGSHTITRASSNPVSVSLSKSGCSFPNNGASCTANGSVTVNGTCSSTAHTFMVVANMSGVKVVFRDGAGNHERTTGSDGTATYTSSTYTSESVTVSKDNCTFSPSAGTVSDGGVFRTTGSCTGDTGACTSCTDVNIHNFSIYSAADPIPATGYTGGVASFKVDCMPQYGFGVKAVAGSTEMPVTSIYVSSPAENNYVVYANVGNNTGSGMTQGYTIFMKLSSSATSGPVCHTFSLSQRSGICNPNPRFSNITCDGNYQSCSLTTTNACNATVINYTLTDRNGTVAAGGVNVSTIRTYYFTPGSTMAAGNVTAKWWAVSDPSISGQTTISSPGSCVSDFTVNPNIHNTGSSTIYVDWIDFTCSDGTTVQISYGSPKTLAPGAWLTQAITIPGAYTGKTVTAIRLRDTVYAHTAYNTTYTGSSTLVNGSAWSINTPA